MFWRVPQHVGQTIGRDAWFSGPPSATGGPPQPPQHAQQRFFFVGMDFTRNNSAARQGAPDWRVGKREQVLKNIEGNPVLLFGTGYGGLPE